MNRRIALGAGVGLLAGAGGIAVSVLHTRDPVARLWSMRFHRPGGGELVFGELRGRPLLLNFWAPWCVPCVTEMPLLAGFAERHPAWNVVGLAVDREEPVAKFLVEHRIPFRVALVDVDSLDLARELGNTVGGLPFSLALGRDGRTMDHRLGALDAAMLERWSSLAT